MAKIAWRNPPLGENVPRRFREGILGIFGELFQIILGDVG
jgi:hypothetical protein